ncbi:hypothetical protein JYU34_022724 [Plutella xylostella]|nr:hypothetical protein JYU34_022724 [Plutella xylostella]
MRERTAYWMYSVRRATRLHQAATASRCSKGRAEGSCVEAEAGRPCGWRGHAADGGTWGRGAAPARLRPATVTLERRCKDSDVLVTVGRQDIGVWKRRREGRQLAARGSRLKRGTEGEGRRAQEYNYLLTYLSRQ